MPVKETPGEDASVNLRHPDFLPYNIQVNTSNEVIGIINWQYIVILPLYLYARIPDYF